MALASKVIQWLGSIKLLILCLLVYFILVICGTFYEVDAGLLAAQKRFFGSWGLLLFNFLPFPGIKTVSVITIINLSVSGYAFLYQRKTGIILIHAGIVVLLLGTGISSFFVKESVLSLFEGESGSFSKDFTKWNFVVYRGSDELNNIADTFEFAKMRSGTELVLPNTKMIVAIETIYANCDGLGFSAEKIDSLVPKKTSQDMSASFPGVKLFIRKNTDSKEKNARVIIFSGNMTPALCILGTDTIHLKLQPFEVALPFKITLNKFVKENHPGTSDARSFKSFVRVQGDGIDRDAVISMNRPFRYKSLTFYQNGFSQQDRGNITTLLVVNNPTRFVPYLSGILVTLGLFVHFISMFLNSYKSLRKGT
jgi:ResB-like family